MGQTAFWFPEAGGKTKVTLLKTTYERQGNDLPRAVRLQVRIKNFGAPPVDPSTLQAEYVAEDGQRFSDIQYQCSLDDTTVLNGGEFVEGCLEFDLPDKPGKLVFGTTDKTGYSSGFDVPLDPTGPIDDTLRVGKSMVLGPNDDGESVKVTLNKVSYPQPRGDDSVSPGRVLVAVEMSIKNISGDSVYGTNVYPNYVTTNGQKIEDTGWVVAADGKYGSGAYSEGLSDTVDSGQLVRGWSLYEVPPQQGELVFPNGPGTFRIPVNPRP